MTALRLTSTLPAAIRIAAVSVLLSGQTPQFESSMVVIPSLHLTVLKLQEQTGWHICLEEPVWTEKIQGGPRTQTFVRGKWVGPPAADALQVSIPATRGPDTRNSAITALRDEFNAGSRMVGYKIETLGVYTVFEAETVRDATGNRIPARLILDTTVRIPIASRDPHGHLKALVHAIRQQLGSTFWVDLDDGMWTLDQAFTGKIRAAMPTPENPYPSGVFDFEWGTTTPRTARMALVDLLSHSITTFDWLVTCRNPVNSLEKCALSLYPMQIRVTSRSGRTQLKTLEFDRGKPDMMLPPPPPEIQ
jgi:hypothetical protein